MGLYEDQLAKIQATEDFLQRQIDLSDDNKVDVIEALLNTDNVFTVDGRIVDKSETSINLEQYLRERNIDPDNLPDYISPDIFSPTKYTDLRIISQIIPIGEGVDLTEIQKTFFEKDFTQIVDNSYGSITTQKESTMQSSQTATIQQQASEIIIRDQITERSDLRLKEEQQPVESLGSFGILALALMVVAG